EISFDILGSLSVGCIVAHTTGGRGGEERFVVYTWPYRRHTVSVTSVPRRRRTPRLKPLVGKYQKNTPTCSECVFLVRVERIELSSQVWKTCILTVVLHPQAVIW